MHSADTHVHPAMRPNHANPASSEYSAVGEQPAPAASAATSAATSATVGTGSFQLDEELQFVLELSLLDEATADEILLTAQLDLEARKRAEEAETEALLQSGGVQLFTAAATAAAGVVTIGSRRYACHERGASHDGDFNLCGYLSLTGGDGPAAVALKRSLAPIANQFAGRIRAAIDGAGVDFAAPGVRADTEVIRAYVIHARTPVCVYNADAGVAQTYRTDDCVNDCKYLYLSGGHFQQLLPA